MKLKDRDDPIDGATRSRRETSGIYLWGLGCKSASGIASKCKAYCRGKRPKRKDHYWPLNERYINEI